jgi:hypothetical protein
MLIDKLDRNVKLSLVAEREAEALEALPRASRVTVAVTELDEAALAQAAARESEVREIFKSRAETLLKQFSRGVEDAQRSTATEQRLDADLTTLPADANSSELSEAQLKAITDLTDAYVRAVSHAIMLSLRERNVPSPAEIPELTVVEEAATHQRFAESLLQLMPTDETALPQPNIRKYIRGTSRHPLVLYAPEGGGKSSVAAHCHKLVASIQTKQHSPFVIVTRFISITPRAVNLQTLLVDICRQVALAYGNDPAKIPAADKGMPRRWLRHLEPANHYQPLVLIIEGPEKVFIDPAATIDLPSLGSLFGWLPLALPEDVKIIAITGMDPPRTSLPPTNILSLEPIRGEKNLLSSILRDLHWNERTLESTHRTALADALLSREGMDTVAGYERKLTGVNPLIGRLAALQVSERRRGGGCRG